MPLALPLPPAAPEGAGAFSTVLAMGGEWGWPNNGEAQYLALVDASGVEVGDVLYVRDGVRAGALVVTSTTEIEGFVSAEDHNPSGGDVMQDGASVVVVPAAP